MLGIDALDSAAVIHLMEKRIELTELQGYRVRLGKLDLFKHDIELTITECPDSACVNGRLDYQSGHF